MGGSKTSQNKAFTLFACCLGTMLNVMSLTTVAIALPHIINEFDSSSALTQWVASSYQLMVGALMLTAGALADRYGYKQIFIGGALVSAVGGIICGLASGSEILIAGRVIEGIGGAVLPPASLALIVHTFKSRSDQHIAIGKYSAAAGLSMALGPLLGGVLIQAASWRMVFFANALFAIATAVVVAMAARRIKTDNPGHKLDIPGQITGGLAMAILLAVIIGFGAKTNPSLLLAGAFAAACLIIIFIKTERRSKAPLIKFADFKSKTTIYSIILAFFLFLGFSGFTFYNVAFLQRVMGMSPLETGFMIVPVALGMFTVSRVAGKLSAKGLARRCIGFGFALLAAGLILLAASGVSPTIPYLLVAYLLVGSGLGAAFGPISTMAYQDTPPKKAGIVSATIATFRMTSGAFGVALVGSIIAIYGVSNLKARLSDPSDSALSIASGGASQGIDVLPYIRSLANESFVYGLSIGYLVMATFAIVGLLITWRLARSEK